MYDSVILNGEQELLAARLAQAVASLRGLTLTTRQEALAQIYSTINGVLSLGNNMTPLAPITHEGPAKPGDVQGNFSLLNQDAQAIIQQLLAAENDASDLYNALASFQNTLRQQLRQKVYAPSSTQWEEAFINNTQSGSNTTANLDFNAGAAAAALSSEVFIVPDNVVTGVTSIGQLAAGSSFDNLFDGDVQTAMVWEGNSLELLFTFQKVQILNTVRVELFGYQGLIVESFTSTPDGILQEDLLADLPGESRSMDGNSSKYSGDWIALFDPRHVQQLRLVVRDVIGSGSIQLRNVYFSQRKYTSSSKYQSVPIQAPAGKVLFSVESHTAANLTSLSHQISRDGVQYVAVTPGQVVDVGNGPYWYQSTFSRLDGNFSAAATPLTAPGETSDAGNYTIGSSNTIDLGGGIVERIIVFSTITGAADLEELPLKGTLSVYVNNVPLASTAYTLNGSVLTFASPQTNAQVEYQTSSYARAGILARQAYYTPLHYGYSFTKS